MAPIGRRNALGRRVAASTPTVVAAGVTALVCSGASQFPAFGSTFLQPLSTHGPPAADASSARLFSPSVPDFDAPTSVGSHGVVCSAAVVGAAATCLAAARQRTRQQKRSPLTVRRVGGGDIEDVVPFEIRGFSLSQLVLAIGAVLILWTFADYAISVNSGGGSGLGSLLLIYSIPTFLLGAALSYAELEPVEVEVSAGAEGLCDSKGTATMKKIKQDVTRHRYGDDAHLDSSLKALGLINKGVYPELFKIIESKTASGELEFTMLFRSKNLPYNIWNDPMKIKSFDRFFGPGIWSSVFKFNAEERIAALRLTTGKRPEDEEAKVQQAIKKAEEELLAEENQVA